MAITYHAGRRIQGLSTDVLNTPTYSDFTGTWTSDSGNEVQASNGVVSVSMGGSNRNDYISFDLGSTLSDSWVLRFKQEATTNSFTLNSGNAGAMYVSLSSGTNLSGEHNDGGSVDSINTRIRHQSTQWKMETFDVRSRVSGTTTSSGDAGQVLATGAQTYYVEVIKDGATTSVKYFDDSAFTSQVGTTKSVSSNSIGTNLQYLGVHIYSQSHSSGDFVAQVSEFKIYDGVSSLSSKPNSVQLGSRYEETDTRKMYYYADPLSVDDDLSTDKGWVSNTSDWTYNASGDYIDFATVRRSTTAQQIYIDMQDSDYLGSGNNLSDSKWVWRCKLTIGALASSGNTLLYIGFTDNLNDSGAIPQHGAMIMLNTSPTENGLQSAISTRNFETSSSPDRINGIIYSSGNLPASSVRYMEMIRDGAVFTLKAFTDSSFSTQAGSTATVTKTGTALTGLRYLKAFNDSEQNGSNSTGTRLDEIKIYNGATSTDTAWSELG